MNRVFESSAAATPPSPPASPSTGFPTRGNPSAAVLATRPGEYWYYMMTEEVRKVITDAGLTPDHENTTQLSAAIQALIGAAMDSPGTVKYVGSTTAPAGYLKANGAAVSRTTYAALFTAIGTTFGVGDGSTTFNLPDLRGEFIRGYDDGRGVDAARVFGSAQSATEIRNSIQGGGGASAKIGVTNYDAITATSQGGVEPTGTSRTDGTTYSIRPRNVALLPVIKY